VATLLGNLRQIVHSVHGERQDKSGSGSKLYYMNAWTPTILADKVAEVCVACLFLLKCAQNSKIVFSSSKNPS
jgi:hypothetical protein